MTNNESFTAAQIAFALGSARQSVYSALAGIERSGSMIVQGKAVDSWDWKAALDPEFRLAQVSTFGQDQDGELYVVTHEGPIFKLVAR